MHGNAQYLVFSFIQGTFWATFHIFLHPERTLYKGVFRRCRFACKVCMKFSCKVFMQGFHARFCCCLVGQFCVQGLHAIGRQGDDKTLHENLAWKPCMQTFHANFACKPATSKYTLTLRCATASRGCQHTISTIFLHPGHASVLYLEFSRIQCMTACYI